jgi:hypothetical protein
MPARAAFNYALVRVVPRVEREEFLNVGAVVFSPTRAFLAARVELDRGRLAALGLPADFDLELVDRHLSAIPAVCAGDPAAGPVARLSLSERFHWVVAPRSTVVQTSAVHTGLAEDPAQALERLMATMVRAP